MEIQGTEEQENNVSVPFKDLKRRVEITRKARIKASKRLRKKHEYYEKITHFYSLLVLILSVWFINIENPDQSLFITKLLLILSLSLTFFTMFLGTKNYKERAGSFETNYQHLDVLLNKIERLEVEFEKITLEMIKQLHREYEKLIIEKENHHDIDYMTTNQDLSEQFKRQILIYKIKNGIIDYLVAIYPMLLIGFILIINYILNK